MSLIILFLLVTGMSLFLPSRVRISKAMNVLALPDDIRSPIRDMKRWREWNTFFLSLPDTQLHIIDSAVGPQNAMEVNGTQISWETWTPDEYVALMRREGKEPVRNGWNLIHHPGSDSTTVQWYMDFKLHWYPWEKFGSLLFERSYGPGMEQGLTNLKKIIQADRISHN